MSSFALYAVLSKNINVVYYKFAGESESGLQQFVFVDDGNATDEDRQYAKQLDEGLFQVFKEHLITNYEKI